MLLTESSYQLFQLTQNKKDNPNKHKFDTESYNLDNVERAKAEEREALIEDNSVIYDDEGLHDEESGGAGPNEAMYIGVDPIPKSLMLTFEEAIQRQKEILDKSSKVNQYVMPVWDSRKHTKHKFYKGDDILKDETSKIFKSLSADFKYELKRISEIVENPVIVKGKLKPAKIIMGKLKSSISLTWAIISIWNYDIQFEKSTIGSLIFPNKDDFPIYNASGAYGIKVRFNGAQRLIIIDDYLPVDSKLNSVLANSKNQFAPQLLEKAIIKLYGNWYEIIDTNPSIEMHHFIGWIPETVKFSDVNNKDNLWSRMKQNFREGNIILSISSNSDEEELDNYKQASKLTSEDSPLLAVLDIREFKDHKLIKWSNPSGSFTSFTIYKPNEANSLTGELIEPVKLLAGSTRRIESTFWLSWDDILENYKQINLWWNPNIYPFKKRVHSYWKNSYSPIEDYPNLSGNFLDEKYSVEYWPQFVFTIPPHKDDFEVRIFLQRHMNSFNNDKNSRYLSFKLFSFEGYRIIYPDDNLRSYHYSNREVCSDVFIFENSTQDESYVLAILKGDNLDSSDEWQFTLDVLSFIDIDVKELPEPVIEESYEVKGKWNDKKPGGDLLSEYSIYNPHYKIEVKEIIHLQIKAECSKNKIMLAIFDGGKSISETPFQIITKHKNPGVFYEGFSWIEIKLDPGEYTVALCTETPSKAESYRIVFNLMENPKLSYTEDLVIHNLSITK